MAYRSVPLELLAGLSALLRLVGPLALIPAGARAGRASNLDQMARRGRRHRAPNRARGRPYAPRARRRAAAGAWRRHRLPGPPLLGRALGALLLRPRRPRRALPGSLRSALALPPRPSRRGMLRPFPACWPPRSARCLRRPTAPVAPLVPRRAPSRSSSLPPPCLRLQHLLIHDMVPRRGGSTSTPCKTRALLSGARGLPCLLPSALLVLWSGWHVLLVAVWECGCLL